GAVFFAAFCCSSFLTNTYKREIEKNFQIAKGENIMRIAVTYENGQIFQHFGHTQQFKLYDVEDGKVVASEVVGTNGQGHGALAEVLNALKADALICGGIGAGAIAALDAAGVKLYGGASGSADAAVEALLAGELNYSPDVQCSHHGAHHGGECGNRGEDRDCRHGRCID
ncbi:MAG: DNA-binding protein, partial [Oscillospiraceae bacterium]|nr:DNA-binding protein [Oscillospiraceae bacterium]